MALVVLLYDNVELLSVRLPTNPNAELRDVVNAAIPRAAATINIFFFAIPNIFLS